MTAMTLPSAGVLAAGAVAGLVAIAVLALAMSREPKALPVLAVIALPFRVPVADGGRTVNLLLPLYAVVAAGTIVHLLPGWLESAGVLRGGGQLREPGQARSRWLAAAYPWRRPTLALDWLLAAAVAVYALQAVYSADVGRAAQNVGFFYVPFLLLYLLLRNAPWTPRLLRACLIAAVGLGVLFAGVGFVEYAVKGLLLNQKVAAANAYANYFRVNSLFYDPNIYGRFLALTMIVVTTVVLWAGQRREQVLGAAALTWLLAGLALSFSQSSIAALLLGLAVLAAWRWDVRSTVYVSAALVAIALVLVAVAPPSLHFGLSGSEGSANNATSGRARLVTGGLDLFARRPLQGFGSGSFSVEYKRHRSAKDQGTTTASHTIPVTVAAEQGLVGLALYVALLVAAALVLFRGAGRSPPRIAVAACFAALVLHTLAYADFLEDPLTWTLLGVGVALASIRGGSFMGDEVASASEASPASPVAAPG